MLHARVCARAEGQRRGSLSVAPSISLSLASLSLSRESVYKCVCCARQSRTTIHLKDPRSTKSPLKRYGLLCTHTCTHIREKGESWGWGWWLWEGERAKRQR